MNTNSSQISSLLTDTIRMLCQNAVDYNDNLRIQGLLVVTADSNRVHVIEISDTLPSSQSLGVDSSGLCETETEANDYKPPAQMPAQDFPSHSPMTYRKMGPSFHMRPGVHRGRGSRVIKLPRKRRGGLLGFPAARGHSQQRMLREEPAVKMEEEPILLVDSPDNTDNAADDMNTIEPKLETNWADATADYQNVHGFPEAGYMPDYQGTDMPSYSEFQSSQPVRGRKRSWYPHTVTSSDGGIDQMTAQDIKPYHLNYGTGELDEDDSQSYHPTVGKSFLMLLY